MKTKFQKAWPCVVAGAPYVAYDNTGYSGRIGNSKSELVCETKTFALARCIVKLLNRECGK
jgi:hypothetical protein